MPTVSRTSDFGTLLLLLAVMVALPNRDRYEDKLIALLGEKSAEQRAELVKLLGDPPNLGAVPAEFWSKLHKDTEIALAVVLMVACASQIRAERWQPPDDEWAPVSDYAQSWASWRANQTAAGFVETTRNRVQGLIERLARTSPDNRADPLQVAAQLETILGGKRYKAVARTEVTGAASAGTLWTADRWKELGRTVREIWTLGPTDNHCPICLAVSGTDRPFWSVYPGAQTGPPIHVSCQCFLRLTLPRGG